MTRYDIVEDWLCDAMDELFDDNIYTSKDFDTAALNTRAACIAGVNKSPDDQGRGQTYRATIKAVYGTRKQATRHIALLERYFPVYRKKLKDELVMSAVLVYIASPIRSVVGTKTGYVVAATVRITVI